MTPDRVVITSGTSEGIELALTALAGPGDEVLIPVPTYPLYTAVLAKIGAKRGFLSHGRKAGVAAGRRTRQRADHAVDSRTRRHRSEQSDRRHVLNRGTTGVGRSRRPPQLSAPRRRGLCGSRVRRSGARHRGTERGSAGDYVFVVVEGVPRARLAIRLAGRGGDRSAGRRARRHQEAGRRPVVQHGTDGICARRGLDRRSVSSAGLPDWRCGSART